METKDVYFEYENFNNFQKKQEKLNCHDSWKKNIAFHIQRKTSQESIKHLKKQS